MLSPGKLFLVKNVRKLKRFRAGTYLTLHEKQCHTSEDVVPPKEAKVVVCGGGVQGAAVAYHLAQMGWGPDTVLVEQGRQVSWN